MSSASPDRLGAMQIVRFKAGGKTHHGVLEGAANTVVKP
ncbi:MAG: Rv2993c-like domain-containing protein [candidate division NC10 bacterium]